ncbi:hypothetical protein M2C68_21850, partial [Pseudomonas sp. BAgro211]|nr:hypothetical protein [Pseudomonas sp. BAgro211]
RPTFDQYRQVEKENDPDLAEHQDAQNLTVELNVPTRKSMHDYRQHAAHNPPRDMDSSMAAEKVCREKAEQSVKSDLQALVG